MVNRSFTISQINSTLSSRPLWAGLFPICFMQRHPEISRFCVIRTMYVFVHDIKTNVYVKTNTFHKPCTNISTISTGYI